MNQISYIEKQQIDSGFALFNQLADRSIKLAEMDVAYNDYRNWLRHGLLIEEQIGEALAHKSEGSQTHTLQNYKVTLTQPIARKVDPEVWESVKGKCPADMQPVKTVISADATGCKYLAANEPELWAEIAPAFTSKPGKLGVKVEEI